MKDWIIGNLIVLSIPVVAVALFMAFVGAMYVLGLDMDDHRGVSTIAVLLCIYGSYRYFDWALTALSKRELRKVISGRK